MRNVHYVDIKPWNMAQYKTRTDLSDWDKFQVFDPKQVDINALWWEIYNLPAPALKPASTARAQAAQSTRA